MNVRNTILPGLIGSVLLAGHAFAQDGGTGTGQASSVPAGEQGWESGAVTAQVGAGTGQTLSAPAGGTVQDPPDEPGWNWQIGLGLGIAPDYKGSSDYTLVPIPKFRAQNEEIFVDLTGLHVTSNVVPHHFWRLGPSLRFDKGRSDVEDDAVDDLNSQSDSFEIGLSAGFEFDLTDDMPSSLGFNVEFLHDIAGASDGGTIVPSLQYFRALSESWNISTGASFTWGSEAYNSYHYGITATQSNRSGLRQFNADEGWTDAAIQLGIGYDLTESWNFAFFGEYKRLFGDAGDSPVTDDRGSKNQFFTGFLVNYGF